MRHVPCILIPEPRFVVRESGRQRVLREQRKNVHAFVVWESAPYKEPELNNALTPAPWHARSFEWDPVTYDPYTHETFRVHVTAHSMTNTRILSAPIHDADWAWLWIDTDNRPQMEALT